MKVLNNFEISLTVDNKTVYNYSLRERKEINKIACRLLKDKRVKFYTCLTLASVAILTGFEIKEILFPVVSMCASLQGASNSIQAVMNEVVGFAKVVLIGMVIFNTILGVGQTIWKRAGASLSYEEIFGILIKNLAILTCGLGVDKICWWLYEMLK